MNNNRIEWIDLCKGFLLMCICFSHFGYMPVYIEALTYGTGNVYVPAFFLLSGVLFSSEKYPKLKDYLANKTKTLLIPYLFFFFTFTIFDWNLYLKPENVLQNNISALIYGGGPYKAAPLWFIIKLFWISVIYYIIQQNISSRIYRIIIILISGILGYTLYYFKIQLPLGIEVIFSSIVFFGTGHIFKENIIRFVKTSQNQNIFIGLSIAILLGFVSRYISHINPDAILGQNKIHNFALFYISSFSGILGIITLMSLIWFHFSRISIANNLFSAFKYIAINALPILSIHCFIIITIDSIFRVIHFQHLLIVFIAKIIILLISFYFIIIPFINKNLYFIMGKGKSIQKKPPTIISF